MSNARAVISEVATPRRSIAVDSSLAEIIKDPSRPVGVPPTVHVSKSVPGIGGIGWALHGLVGALRHGIAYSVKEGLEKHGDVYRAPFVGNEMLVVWDADEIHKIMRNEEEVWSTAMGWDALMFQGLDPSGNVGALLALDFEDHRAARKLVQPAFTLNAIKGYIRIAERGFGRVLPEWLSRGRVDFKAEIRSLLAHVANDMFTGVTAPERVREIERALSDFWHGMLAIARNPWVSPTFRRSRAGLLTLRQQLLDLVRERRKSGGDDLFSQLCQNTDPAVLSDEQMVRIFVTVLFGAFDTTAAGMTSMAYLLAKHPEWQERVREEAMQIPAAELDVSSMKSLKELEWVWKETLRLMPVNGLLPRRALRATEVGGFKLEAGTMVAPMNGGIGRHPKWWKDPTKFDPERFSPARAEDKQHPGIYNPFGGGVHACIGMQLANLETKLFWHKLLCGARFSLEKDYEARHTFTPMGVVSGSVSLKLEPLARPK